MSSRKFKSNWTPTPLRVREVPDTRSEEPEPVPPPDEPELAELPGSALASVAGAALVTAAAAARDAVTNTGLATAAGSALASAQASVEKSALMSAAESALAKAHSSAAGSLLASALEPLPSPVSLAKRASFILKFLLLTIFRELIYTVRAGWRSKATRPLKSAWATRRFAERLGGSWITLLRLASLRSDLLGAEYCRILAHTRDYSLPVALNVVRAIVDAELRTRESSFDDTFSEFDEQPITVRSFGQTHRARLRKNGREVLVRVRAPDAVRRAATDWRYQRVLLFLLEQFGIEPHMRWGDLFFEVKQSTDDLLDFRTEVEELRRIRKILRPRKIYVPIVYWKLCTEQVLIVEHITGVDVEDLMNVAQQDPERCDAWMRENGVDFRRVWRRLFNAHNEMLFEHNFFFTELVPSSIILLKDNRLAFLNSGTIGTLDAELQHRYGELYRALLEKDFSKTCDIYLEMGPALPYKDLTGMKLRTQRALRKWESRTHVKRRPYNEKSLSSAMDQLAHCAREQELPAQWNLARLQAAELRLNKSLEFFNPQKSGFRELRHYERAAEIRAIKNAATKKVRKRIDAATEAAQLNIQLIENLQYDGEYVRRRLMGVQAKLSKISEVVGRLVKIVAETAMIVLLLQVALHFTRGSQLPAFLTSEGPLGRIFIAVRPQSNLAWILLIVVLFFFRHMLQNITRQLFAKEVRPGDVL